MTRVLSPDPRPFDTGLIGTAESQWFDLLSESRLLTLDIRSLLVVSPHPDDETLAVGGLMRAAVLRGLQVTVVSVTDGEMARPTESDLAWRRCRELDRAMKTLGRASNPIRVLRLRLPDGAVASHESELGEMLLQACTTADLMIGPYEYDGHTDHEATARACSFAARSSGVQLISYPIWAWHHASPRSLGKHSWVRFDLDAGLRRCKARAIECFGSQLDAHREGPIVPPHVLHYFARSFEAFIS